MLSVRARIAQAALAAALALALGAPSARADFAFDASGIGLLPRTDIIGGVRPTDYGLFLTISNVPQIPITGSDLTFYGVPANRNGGGGAATPFITLPTFCDGPQTSTLTLE